MAFKDEYQDFGGASFIGSEEKKALADDGTEFTIKGVYFREKGGYQGKSDAYVLTLDLDDEERALSFTANLPEGGVPSRDRMLAEMVGYLDRDDAEPIEAKLVKKGQSFLLELV